MKKVLMAAAVMLFGYALAHAGDGTLYGVPRGGPQNLATADYGGVDYATAAFSANMTTVTYFNTTTSRPSAAGVFYGVMFTSGSTAAYDFVDVWDSTNATTALLQSPITRIYNVNGSTGNAGTAFALSGFNGPPKPIRFKQGLLFRASVATYNMITVLFQKYQ